VYIYKLHRTYTRIYESSSFLTELMHLNVQVNEE